MDIRTVEGVAVEGLAACVPAGEVRNDAKVAQSTGIVTRRVAAKGTTVVDLCVRAAERTLADTGARPDEFGAILCVSFTSRERMPAAAVQAQARLGFPRDIVAFDVSLACSGWGYGLYLGALLVRETGRKVLVLDGDVQSDRATDDNVSCLLGDAGTATVLGPQTSSSVSSPWRFAFRADGDKGAALKLLDGGTIQMDGFGVFRFVATDVVSAVREFLPGLSGFTFVPHQPNVYMVRQLAKSVGIDEVKTAISCDAFGNLSSASIPVTIAAKNVRGNVVIAGFGGGLSVSLGALTLAESAPLSVVS